ncbi:MAG: DEAD/DEAH box helicase family protein [bacterium]|nr:DEAD/DEAH box helicase family protein [bacterium]
MAVIKARVAEEIFLSADQVDEDLFNFIKHELVFFNPKIIELKRLGYSTWQVPKTIKCFRQLKSGYYLPLGFGGRLRQYLNDRYDELILDDQRTEKKVSKIKSKIQLKENQNIALAKILKQNRCILEAKPGFGKTVLGIQTLVEKQQKTLIIVHTRALLAQWQKRLADFCELEDGDLGIIGEGKWKIGKKITLASYQTLLSRGTKSSKNDFGLVIVDECHHVPANTFSKVVRGFASKYCLGLTATPFRKDKLDKLMSFYIGGLIPTSSITTSDEASLLPKSPITTDLIICPTQLTIKDYELKEFTELGTILGNDSARLLQVIEDVEKAMQENKKIIVLSERVGHCELLFELLKKRNKKAKAVLVTGQMKKSDREKLFEEIKQNKYQLIVATGGVVGEGFDWPALDTLFLTFPFSWRGKLIQYVGRVQRAAPGKTQATVYDYVDENMSIFQAMFRKRLNAYRELGVPV